MICGRLGAVRVFVVALCIHCTCRGAGALAVIIEDDPLQSCTHVAGTLSSLVEGGEGKVLSRHAIHEQLQQAQSGVCDLERSCCSDSAELIFKSATTQSYQQQVQKVLAEILMPCHNHNVSGEIVEYIAQSKDNLVSSMRRAYLFYFDPYTHIFDEFYEYLEQSIQTGDLCEIEEQFTKVSFEVFYAGYHVSAQVNGVLPSSDLESLRSCLFDYFLETRGVSVANRLHVFLRAYSRLMRYVRALKLMDVVIEGVLDLPLTKQCQDALTKMTHCSQCAGYTADLLPCQGLCHNNLRGCLVDISDLVKPIREFTDAMVTMNNQLNISYNPWDQITLLRSYFFTVLQGVHDEGVATLLSRCEVRSKRGALSGESPFKQQHMITKRNAPPSPTTSLNHSTYCLGGTVNDLKSIPETVCVRVNASQRNVGCWTGTALGRYERSVIDFKRSAQKDNPELVICSERLYFQRQINQLGSITRELNVITGRTSCSFDDEDCVTTVPDTCNYFNFDDLFHTYGSSGSGSGSGVSGSGGAPPDIEDGDDDTDACNRNNTLDIDYCSIGNGGCQHHCISSGNSYRCECNSGYRLRSDGVSCEALCTRNFTSIRYGVLTTPNWPETYPENVTCEWFIELPNKNKVVEITCDGAPYGIGGNYPLCEDDRLTIFDGHSEQDDQFGPYCRFRRPRAVKTSTNLAKVVFHSGPSHRQTRKGFKCNFRAVNKPRLWTVAKIRLLRYTGSFQTPNWPETYPNNVNYEWKIVLPNQHKRVQLTFERPFGIDGFLPGCRKDYLKVYDDASGQVYGPYCHVNVPERIATSSNVVTVVFHSGPSHRPSRRGFKANYYSVD